MVNTKNGTALCAWSAPECPFTIEYSPQVLDNVRLAVMDAFFSLPRGGAEIGGILCGNWDGARLTITGYAALDCEHAFGPSFTLSPRDEAQLAILLGAAAANNSRPVGWYHSHTRSEIFLSDVDQEIHRRFFPEPWQIALVLKPHTFHPTRAGFFFRDSSGAIHAEASYAEFVLMPLAASPTQSTAEPAPSPDPVPLEPEKLSAPLPVPAFLEKPAQPRRRWPIALAAALLVCSAIGAAAYWQRNLWLPRIMAMTQPRPSPAPPPLLGLSTIDSEGQLQIRWDRNSPSVQRATGGALSIGDGGPSRQEIPLDKDHLLSGVFTFARQTERVDVSLDLTEPDGSSPREVTAFMGRLPDRKPAEDPAAEEQRGNLAKQLAKMRTDLDRETTRNAKLQKSIDQLNKRLHIQPRPRSVSQAREKR